MTEKPTKIEELEYFNPFDWISNQCIGLIPSDVFYCDLKRQQQLFLYMACSDNIEEDFEKNKKYCHLTNLLSKVTNETQQRKHQWLTSERLHKLQEWIDNRYFTYINVSGDMRFMDENAFKLDKKMWQVKFLEHIYYTEESKDKLNKKIKQLKINIDKYIKSIELYLRDIALFHHQDLYKIKKHITNRIICKYEDSYIFYLQEILRTFKTYNNINNQQTNIHKQWHKIFDFKNNTDLFNFQGCLGLLLINEFCFYYNKKQIEYCILCAMLLTSLYTYSPLHKKIEIEHQKELNRFLAKEQKMKANRSRAGSITKNEAFKQWCINFNEKNFPSRRQKALYLAEYYQKNYKEIKKEFPETTLTREDPFNSIYGWLKSK